MKRLPIVGDVVRIANSKVDQLVVEAHDSTSYDTLRGESYPAFRFRTIPYSDGVFTDPKEKKYLISMCMHPEKGEAVVDLLHVEWVGSAKVKKKLSTTYTIKG